MPVGLQEQLQSDLRDAMKARDRERTSALRMAIAAVKDKSVAEGKGPQGELSDETVQTVLTREVKRRRESAAAFRDAGRAEQATREDAEAAVYEAYLPAQLSDDEILAVVDRVVADTGASGMGDMGPVMKATMNEVQGQADGSRVSALVKQRLA